jgi:hypothetical protein
MRGHDELHERLGRVEVLTFSGHDHHTLLAEPRLKKAVLKFLRR